MFACAHLCVQYAALHVCLINGGEVVSFQITNNMNVVQS